MLFNIFKQSRTFNKPKNGWYYMLADKQQIDIYLYNDIGLDGIMASDFINEIKRQGEGKPIVLHINCRGGDVFEGAAIMAYLEACKQPTTAIVEGLGASMASLIALSCKAVKMASQAELMIHNPQIMIAGDAKALRDEAANLDLIKDNAVLLYAKKFTKLTIDQIKKLMDDTTWINIPRAREYGLVFEEVGRPTNKLDKFDLSVYPNVPFDVLMQYDASQNNNSFALLNRVKELEEQIKNNEQAKQNIKPIVDSSDNVDLTKMAIVSNSGAASMSGTVTFNQLINMYKEQGMTYVQAYQKAYKDRPDLLNIKM